MLTKEQHTAVVARCEGKVYQNYDRLRKRLGYFEQFAELFEDKSVVEFGCNAGFYGTVIAEYANSYLGVDRSPRYIRHANEVRMAFPELHLEFEERKVKGWLRDRQKARDRGEDVREVNAMFASFALYHFSDKEIVLLENELLPGCEIVIIQTRTQKRQAWRDHNSHKFWKVRNVEKWLERNGFAVVSHWGPERRFADTIATRALDALVSGDATNFDDDEYEYKKVTGTGVAGGDDGGLAKALAGDQDERSPANGNEYMLTEEDLGTIDILTEMARDEFEREQGSNDAEGRE